MENIKHLVKTNFRLSAFILLALVLVIIFLDDFNELLGRWLNEERYSHAPLVLVMALYLIWIRRFELNNTNQGAWIGVLIVAISSFALFIGKLSAIGTIVEYSVLLLCLGVAWAMVGHQIKKILIPFLHLFLVIPLPYMLDVMLSGKMQLISSNLGVAITRMMGLSVFQEGNVIDLGLYKLQVVEACSGLNYMYPMMTLSLMLAYMYKAPFFARTLVFLSSVPISIVMNSFRIAVVAIFVNYSGIKAAEGFMHYFEGWVIFMLCIGILLLEVMLLNKLLKQKVTLADSFDYLESGHKPLATAYDNTTTSSLNIKPIVVAYTMVLIASFSTLLFVKRDEVIPQRSTFDSYPAEIDGWQSRAYFFENGEETALKLKDYLLRNYTKANQNIDLYMGYVDSQRNEFVPHSPKACIPGGGWEITDTRLEPILMDDKKQFKVTRLLIRKGEAKQLVYYWFRQRGRDLSNEFPMKFALLYDSIYRNRTDGALVRVTSSVYKSEAETDAMMVDFIRKNYAHLPQFIPD